MELLEDIIRVYPENVDMISSKNTFSQIKKMNPTAIIKSWYIFIYSPYKDIIEGGDVDYFFSKDYSNDLNLLKRKDKVLETIEKVRIPLQMMSTENKQNILKYLSNLNKLSVLYNDSLEE